MTNSKKPRTTRAVKKEEVRKASKRIGRGSKLSIPPGVLDNYPPEKFYLQWVNNEKGEVQRIQHDLHGEVCKGEGVSGVWSPDDTSANTSDVISRPVGRGRTLDNMDAVLMAIPIEIWEEEKEARRQDKLEATESLRHGTDQSGATTLSSGGTYAPNLGNGATGYSEKDNDKAPA